MKPMNFPARKLLRQLNAKRDMSTPFTADEIKQLRSAEHIRTKKNRANAR